MEKNLYFKNLDASRFFAFLLVFLAHCFVTTDPEIKSNDSFQAIYNWGKVGVLGLEYFFVLSSFLISFIILEEKKQQHSFHISYFLIRRSLRVWPLYFLILGIGFISVNAAAFLNIDASPLPPWPYMIFFVINFYIIQHGTAFLFFIAFLWSISVEEQFYLIWSLFMKFVKIRFDLFCYLLIISSLIFRYLNFEDDASMYFHTISTLGNFGIGGLLAWSLHRENKFNHFLKSLPPKSIYLIYLALGLSIIFYHQLTDISTFRLFSRIIYSSLFAFLILNQAIGKYQPFNMGKSKLFNYLGKISYGLYCYHGIVVTLMVITLRQLDVQQSLFMSLIVFPIVIFALSVLLSHLSYRYFEVYFLKFKERFYTFKP